MELPMHSYGMKDETEFLKMRRELSLVTPTLLLNKGGKESP